MLFDLKELESFTEIARLRNFTKAAAVLHTTQPSLSRTIRELEERLGVTLIERTTRKVVLTDAGELLERCARTILASCRELESALQKLASPGERGLAIGYGSRAQFDRLLQLVHILHRDHPDLDISISHGITLEQLYLGQADAAFMMEQTASGQDWVDHIPIDSSGLSAFFPVEHPFSSRADVSVRDLADCELVIPSRHTSDKGIQFFSLHDQICSALLRCGLSESQFITEYDAQSFSASILNSRRIGIMADSSAIIENEWITCRPIRECREGFGIILAWRRDERNAAFVRMLRSAATDLSQNRYKST